MRTKECIKPCRSWNAPFTALLFAGIITIALCASSCRTSRESLQQSLSDSLRLKEIRTTTYVPVPGSRVILPICPESLRELPEGVGYHQKSGQANLNVRKKGDTVYIEASCDSLERMIVYYSQELTKVKTEQHLNEKKTYSIPVQMKFKYFSYGVLFAIATMGVWFFRTKKNILTIT